MGIKIVVAEQDTLFCDGLCSLIHRQSNMKIAGKAADGRTAVERVRQLSPDIVIAYADMPDLNGIDLTRQITAECPHAKVIALSTEADVQFIIEIFKAGASGYLLKNCSREEVIRAINAVVKHGTYLSPEASDLILESFLMQCEISDMPAFSRLTKREQELFLLISDGKSIRQIAAHFNRSRKTIEAYRRSLLNKLNIHNTVAITKYAIREGLIAV